MTDGPRSLDGVTSWLDIRWRDQRTVTLKVRPELINMVGILSGPVAYAMVDYSMGSTLWEHITEDEMIATLNISITYLQGAREGLLRCESVLDRRTRTNAALRSEVRADADDRLLATALGSFVIFDRTKKGRPEGRPFASPES